MSPNDPGLSISRSSGWNLGFLHFGSHNSTTPISWINHKGFFAYIDDSDRIWAYNGKDRTFIYEIESDTRASAYDIEGWPGEIPSEVSSRLK